MLHLLSVLSWGIVSKPLDCNMQLIMANINKGNQIAH